MAILKSNLIEGQKPEFGNRHHINFVQRLEGIRNGERPIIQHSDFEGICGDGKDYMECLRNCRCSKSKAVFKCINCKKLHTVISGYNISNSPIACKCGFTYSELHGGHIDEWFLISDGSEDTIY